MVYEDFRAVILRVFSVQVSETHRIIPVNSLSWKFYSHIHYIHVYLYTMKLSPESDFISVPYFDTYF
jgi:hypothetical protein